MKAFSIRVPDELYNILSIQAKEKKISLNELVNQYLNQNPNESGSIERFTSSKEMVQPMNHFSPENGSLSRGLELIENINRNVNQILLICGSHPVNHKYSENEPLDVNHSQYESGSPNMNQTPEQNKPQDEPETPNENGSQVNQNSYDPYPFDEFDFLLIGPQDICRQIINNDFSRNTIKWNESVFNGKHEDQYNYKRLIDTPKNLDNEISILGQQDWNRWKAAISCMPASNDIIPLPLPQNPKHQWMYIFLAAGPHISSREAFCGLIKQAYKETRDERWKNPGNTIATLEPFTYAAAMEIIWPALMIDRYLGDE